RPVCAATSTSSTRRSSWRARTASGSSAQVIRERSRSRCDPRSLALATSARLLADRRGYQNITRFVSCAAGEYVLRVYTNVADAGQQRFEHELLRRLAGAGLSFEVPRPLASDDGDTLRTVDGRLAALFARIDADPLPKDGGAYLPVAAAALAELDAAMGELPGFDHHPPAFDGDPSRMH